MATIHFEGCDMHYTAIDEMLDDTNTALKQIAQRIHPVDKLGVYELLHELMENYVENKYIHPSDKGALRNEFIKIASIALNDLSGNEIFQDTYFVEYIKG